MNHCDLYEEAVKRLPTNHIDHHESDLYIKGSPESHALMEEYKIALKGEYGNCCNLIKTFSSIHPDDKGAMWYDIPFHYTPFWKERGC